MSENKTNEELTDLFVPNHPSSPLKNRTSEPMPTRKLMRWAKILAAVFTLALVLIVVSALFAGRRVSEMVMTPFRTSSDLSNIFIDKSRGNIVFTDRHVSPGDQRLLISFPYHFISRSDDPLSEECAFSDFASRSTPTDSHSEEEVQSHTYHQVCFNFENKVQAAVYEKDIKNGLECFFVHWSSQQQNPSLETCIDMSSDNWYGGGELSDHHWPLNRAEIPMQPFITRKFYDKLPPSSRAHFGSFLEPYFLSARGVAVLVDDNVPLFASINNNQDKKICLRSAFEKPFDKANSSQSNSVHLKYTVCYDNSAKAVHSQMLASGSLPHPRQAPSLDLLQKPVWSTRGQDISDEIQLLSYVNSIKVNGLNFSQLFIDGNYSRSIGNFYFNEKKFPHSAQLVMELDEELPHKKLRVGTQVFPLISDLVKNKNFSFFFDKTKNDQSNSKPDDALLLDVFNKKATDWYASQLNQIRGEIHIQAFRFSGGEVSSYLSQGSMKPLRLNSKFSFNEITRTYSQIASTFGDSSFVGSGYRSQIYGLISDSGPFHSSWEYKKGLKSVIPTVITLGLLGYPFVSAGPIGGIHKDAQTGHFIVPPRNLYLRWLQLSIFLPVVEFSVGPWAYEPSVANYTKSLLDYRQKVLWPDHLSAAVSEAVDVGTPIIRPLWWIAPDDPKAQFIDCEFMLSNSLLVAPVLNHGQLARDIYLPVGSWWQDMIHGKFYKGGQWLPQFAVGQYQIATFIRTSPPVTNS